MSYLRGEEEVSVFQKRIRALQRKNYVLSIERLKKARLINESLLFTSEDRACIVR